jgi:hypothetical protein
MLFLAKYVGGCAFITICATYLIGGLWLILGARFGVWDPRLLASIPIYLFVFAVYYSVSALASVIWRSPIVSIALSIIFWLACFSMGLLKSGVENLFLNKDRFVRTMLAGDALWGIDEFGWGYLWQEEQRTWKDVFVLPEQRQARPFLSIAPAVPRPFRAVGHVYQESKDRLLAAIPSFPPSTTHFCVGPRKDEWEPATTIAAPTGIVGMFREPSGEILIASSLGLSRLTGDPAEKRDPVKVLGFTLPLPAGDPFQRVNPDPPVLITQPADVALNPQTGGVAIYTRGLLHLLTPQGARFAHQVERKLDGDPGQSAVVGFGGPHLLVGRDDGRIQVLDAATLEVRREFQPEGRNPPRFVEASPDGKWFAITFHTQRLWLYDTESEALTMPRVSGQGSISAANFAPDGTLFVVDNQRRASRYGLAPLQLQRRYDPGLGTLMALYRYGLVPLYTVFPKPGEMDQTFQYLLSGKTTASVEDGDDDLTSAQTRIDPWEPLWSSAAFTLVVLLIACLYIEYQDF